MNDLIIFLLSFVELYKTEELKLTQKTMKLLTQMTKPFFFVFFFISSLNSLFSQTFYGKIVDESQSSIEGVSISNQRQANHTHSNEHGEFSLENATIGDVLQISILGYETEFFEITDIDTTATIVLREEFVTISKLVVTPKLNALNLVTDIDLKTQPVNSSQDILRKVPGLFIGQHAGGGKAEQIFLRGFDIDHGTDINITVDGLPVNMVSHAHGQGYADLHFLIPETIEEIDFGKGPYFQDKGNFNTAGYVNFATKERLKNNTLRLEAGQFDKYRLLGMFNLSKSRKQNAYIATEFLSTDGFFESPQNFNRINLFGKYSTRINDKDKIGITASYFDSKWDASGQIPVRAVEDGSISRFGAIDDTEGGSTSRTHFLLTHERKIDRNSSIKSKAFLNSYDFELLSNFTFFLEEPANGDQIKQRESRVIYGLNSDYQKSFSKEDIKGTWNAGFSLRNDKSNDNELSRTRNRRETLERLSFGDVDETNLGAYLGTTLNIGKWTFNPSVRVDYFDFQYNNELLPAFETQSQDEAIVSPKLNILYNASKNLQLFAKTGKGFHSNDTRVIIEQEADDILPAAYGFDLGYIWKPTPKMFLSMAYWFLYLEQEFVYVGDAGIVEPSGETRRQGLDFSYRYQPLKWLYWNTDATYTYARAVGASEGEDLIPLAPEFTLESGLNFLFDSGLYGSLNVRHLGDRPANEDNSIVAEGYTVADMNMGYKWNNMNVGVRIENLFDTEWEETQFATESRLQGEIDSVEEIHFTPGTPFFTQAFVQFNF